MIDNSHHLSYEDHFGRYPIPDDLNANSKIVDIGANKGHFTSFASQRYGIVHSYEPIKKLAEIIRNNNQKNVTIFNESVGPHLGKTKIYAHKSKDSGSSTVQYALENIIEAKSDWIDLMINECDMVDLETVLQRIGGEIDYLKMDCENSEYGILMNKELKSIKYIGIEIHAHMGKYRWDELKHFVSKTHNNFPDFSNSNIETLLTRK
jgi:FkbM family methyltransferase